MGEETNTNDAPYRKPTPYEIPYMIAARSVFSTVIILFIYKYDINIVI